MPENEKRKFIRHDSLFLLDYIIVDKAGNRGVYSMGRTLDVSADGIKLEILNDLEKGTLLYVTVGLKDDLIELLGEVTHTHAKDGRFVSGIAFRRITARGRAILARYSEAVQLRMKELEKSDGTTKPL